MKYLLDTHVVLWANLTPFDRMLIATALAGDLTLVTIDEHIKKYDVPQIW